MKTQPAPTMVKLSPRQVEILRMVADDRSDKEIAAALDCSVFTVRSHLRMIFERLSVHGRAGAAVAWVRASQKLTS
jgi:DNA-binding CsgD family transcriptional regulator